MFRSFLLKGFIMSFNKEVFDASFSKNVARLGRVENMTRELVKNMSREVVHAVHETGDIGYVNKTLNALTLMNRRTFVLFSQEFTGFVYDEKAKAFESKAGKKQYAKCKAAFDLAMTDPHFNMWTWAEKNVSVEKKPLDLEKITQYMKSALKKADDEDISQADVLRAVLKGGIEFNTLIAVMQDMAEENGIEVTDDRVDEQDEATEE